jgi:hypothetical protein
VRRLIVIPLLALAAVPAIALGQTTPADRAKATADCAALLTSMGAATFQQTYAPKGSARAAMAKCIARFSLIENQNVKNAAKDCRTEQSQMSAADFAKKYNANANGHNAFGKCVSTKAKTQSKADVQATVNAAKACKAERRDPNFASAHGGQTFVQFYGKGSANAFGQCVKTKAKTGHTQ